MAKNRIRDNEKYVTKKQVVTWIVVLVIGFIFLVSMIASVMSKDAEEEKLYEPNRVCVFNSTSIENNGQSNLTCANLACATENYSAYSMAICQGGDLWFLKGKL